MKIEIEINDKVWADFCLYVESPHGPNCQCKVRGVKEPNAALSAILGMSLLDHKRTDFRDDLRIKLLAELGFPEDMSEEDFTTKITTLGIRDIFIIFGRLAHIDDETKKFTCNLAEEYGITQFLPKK